MSSRSLNGSNLDGIHSLRGALINRWQSFHNPFDALNNPCCVRTTSSARHCKNVYKKQHFHLLILNRGVLFLIPPDMWFKRTVKSHLDECNEKVSNSFNGFVSTEHDRMCEWSDSQFLPWSGLLLVWHRANKSNRKVPAIAMYNV